MHISDQLRFLARDEAGAGTVTYRMGDVLRAAADLIDTSADRVRELEAQLAAVAELADAYDACPHDREVLAFMVVRNIRAALDSVEPAAPAAAAPLRAISNPVANSEAEAGEAPDLINHPPHYTSHPSGVECIDVIEHLPFNVGAAIKYLWRCELKGAHLEDLKKARWYVEREIARREAGDKSAPEPAPKRALQFGDRVRVIGNTSRHAYHDDEGDARGAVGTLANEYPGTPGRFWVHRLDRVLDDGAGCCARALSDLELVQ